MDDDQARPSAAVATGGTASRARPGRPTPVRLDRLRALAHPLRALAHPLRLRLLSLLTGQSADATEAARELGCSQANLTDAELWVAPQDWQAFRAAVEQAAIDLHEAARPARSRGTVRVSVTISAFRMRQR